jgi:hypothetical protein
MDTQGEFVDMELVRAHRLLHFARRNITALQERHVPRPPFDQAMAFTGTGLRIGGDTPTEPQPEAVFPGVPQRLRDDIIDWNAEPPPPTDVVPSSPTPDSDDIRIIDPLNEATDGNMDEEVTAPASSIAEAVRAPMATGVMDRLIDDGRDDDPRNPLAAGILNAIKEIADAASVLLQIGSQLSGHVMTEPYGKQIGGVGYELTMQVSMIETQLGDCVHKQLSLGEVTTLLTIAKDASSRAIDELTLGKNAIVKFKDLLKSAPLYDETNEVSAESLDDLEASLFQKKRRLTKKSDDVLAPIKNAAAKAVAEAKKRSRKGDNKGAPDQLAGPVNKPKWSSEWSNEWSDGGNVE